MSPGQLSRHVLSLSFFRPPSAIVSLLRTGRTPPAWFSAAYPSTEVHSSATFVTFLQIKNIFRNFYIQANTLYSVSIWSSKSEHSKNVPDHLFTCSCEGKIIFYFTHLQWHPHHFNIWLKTSLLACKHIMAHSKFSRNISFCSPSYFLCSAGTPPQSEVLTSLINHIPYF